MYYFVLGFDNYTFEVAFRDGSMEDAEYIVGLIWNGCHLIDMHV